MITKLSDPGPCDPEEPADLGGEAAGDGAKMPGLRRIRVSDLMPNERQIILEHAGEHYVLRITAKGKLILTK